MKIENLETLLEDVFQSSMKLAKQLAINHTTTSTLTCIGKNADGREVDPTATSNKLLITDSTSAYHCLFNKKEKEFSIENNNAMRNRFIIITLNTKVSDCSGQPSTLTSKRNIHGHKIFFYIWDLKNVF